MLLGSLEGISICGEVVFLRLLSIVEGVNLILGASLSLGIIFLLS